MIINSRLVPLGSPVEAQPDVGRVASGLFLASRRKNLENPRSWAPQAIFHVCWATCGRVSTWHEGGGRACLPGFTSPVLLVLQVMSHREDA